MVKLSAATSGNKRTNINEFDYKVELDRINVLSTIGATKNACKKHYGPAYHYSGFYYQGAPYSADRVTHLKTRVYHSRLFKASKAKLHELATTATTIPDYMQNASNPTVEVSIDIEDMYKLFTQGINNGT